MNPDDLPRTPHKPPTRLTLWWVLGLAVIALAVWGVWTVTGRGPLKAPAEANTRTMSRSPTALPGDAP